jgi:hexosaminidase
LVGTKLSSEATVMCWRGAKIGQEAAKAGHNVVMCPTSHAYLDYQQGEQTIEPPMYASLRLKQCYSFEPVPDSVDSKYILGGQANLWTEQVPTLRHVEYMIFPRAWAVAETYWSPKEQMNWTNFIDRVENRFKRSDIAEVNYSKAIYDPIIRTINKNNTLWLEIETEANGLDVYYSIDGTMPDSFSPKYSQPIAIPNGPVTLRVISYRNNKPIGHLITLKPEDLKSRSSNN